jgi:hypothetical protein
MSEKEKDLSVVFVYSQDFMERVIRNLINDPSYCKSCGLYCESCKYNVYSFVRKVRAAIQLPKPADLPAFVDNTEEFMPKKLPEADLCLAPGLHRDLLLELPEHLKKAGIKALIAPIEDWQEVPTGLESRWSRNVRNSGWSVRFRSRSARWNQKKASRRLRVLSMKQRLAARYLKFPPPPSAKTRLSSTLRSGEAPRAVQRGM